MFYFVFPVIVEYKWFTSKHGKERLEKTQKKPQDMFYQKVFSENFGKLTGKHLCQSLFLNKASASNFIK